MKGCKGYWFAVVVSVGLASCTQGGQAPAANDAGTATVQQPPNIIILLADDLGYGDLGSYGHPNTRKPNLDQLAAQGQRWTDFYAPAPVCSPSRGALLTGKYPPRTGLYGKRIAVMFPNEPHGMVASETTIAEALQQRGYATGMVGKWHLGDSPNAYPTRHGFDLWFGLPYSNDMDWVNALDFDELIALSLAGRTEELGVELGARQPLYFAPKVSYWNVPLLRSERVAADKYADSLVERPAQQPTLTKRYTEQALEFIAANQHNPFLLYVPYNMPHTPLFASDKLAGNSLGGLYGDVIEELDWSVGEIVDQLERLDLAENTLVVFTSDNGPWLTMRHHGGSAGLLNNGKGTTFEGGMRVPAVFWWPGTVAPATISGIGSALDLYRTVLALVDGESADSAASQATDSLDLSATLTQGAPSARQEFAFYRAGELYAYRLGQYKLHLVVEGAYQQPPARLEQLQLFHLGEDPAEQFDIAAKFPDVVAQIRSAIERHQRQLAVMPPLFDRRLARFASQTQSEK